MLIAPSAEEKLINNSTRMRKLINKTVKAKKSLPGKTHAALYCVFIERNAITLWSS